MFHHHGDETEIGGSRDVLQGLPCRPAASVIAQHIALFHAQRTFGIHEQLDTAHAKRLGNKPLGTELGVLVAMVGQEALDPVEDPLNRPNLIFHQYLSTKNAAPKGRVANAIKLPAPASLLGLQPEAQP